MKHQKFEGSWKKKVHIAVVFILGSIVVLSLMDYRMPVQYVAIERGLDLKNKAGNSYELSQIAPKVGNLKPNLKKCYLNLLGKTPDLKGASVDLDWAIQPDGTVDSAHVTKSEIEDVNFTDCLTREVSSLIFSPPPGGTVFFASHKFRFSKSGKSNE